MKYFETIYDENTLNIFTDASMYSGTWNNYTVGCAGVELATSIIRTDVVNNLYPNGYVPNYIVTLDTSNNNSELIALSCGILFAIANKNRFKTINLFSDSLLSVNSINDWSRSWFYKSLKNRDWDFKTTNGTPVANQQIIKQIMCLIYYNDLKINIYHQRGHCSNKLDLVKKDFIKFNNLNSNDYVSDKFIEEITFMNDLVDKRSRNTMNTFIKTGYAPHIVNNTLIPGLEYDVSRMNFKYFKYLIGK